MLQAKSLSVVLHATAVDVDYAQVDQQLSFSQSGSMCVDVLLLDDNFIEGTERFLVLASTEVDRIPTATATVAIMDEPGGERISLNKQRVCNICSIRSGHSAYLCLKIRACH